MNKLLRSFYSDRSVEEIIFSVILMAGIPYFTINEIIDIFTNQNWLIFCINVSLLGYILYLLKLSYERKLNRKHIFGFSLVLIIGFSLFWPNSTGLSGAGAYVFQSLMVAVLLVNTGKAKLFFAVFLFILILIAGFAPIEYTGKIVYSHQLISFMLNTIVIALAMNLFKNALERERRQMVRRIGQLENANEKLAAQNAKLEKNHLEITRIQTQLQEIISERTQEIEKANRRMIEYAFINAHLVRAPLANLLGLLELKSEEGNQYQTLKSKTENLDKVVRKIGGILSVKKE